jgi:hypothetical protein
MFASNSCLENDVFPWINCKYAAAAMTKSEADWLFIRAAIVVVRTSGDSSTARPEPCSDSLISGLDTPGDLVH